MNQTLPYLPFTAVVQICFLSAAQATHLRAQVQGVRRLSLPVRVLVPTIQT